MKRRTRLPVAAVLLFCPLALLAESGQSANQVVADWLRDHAIRLETVEARHGFADMQQVKQIVGDARIVSLGEATHGSREFFQLKHRMLEMLASEMGFTIFAIEANMPESYRVDEYVQTGKGDPAQLLKGMYFWTWDTEEVLEMIRWMREFNASGKGNVHFTGYDMQFPDVPSQIAKDFIAKHEPAYSVKLDAAWRDVKATEKLEARATFGVAAASLPVEVPAGKHVRYSGYIRTEAITRGYAGLWFRVDTEKAGAAFDNMANRGPHGTTGWARYEISLDVPANAKTVVFGVLHPGDGTAWFDDLRIELDGVPYTDPDRFDFGFESESLKGMTTAGTGYEVGLDKGSGRDSRQSLRSRYVGLAAGAPVTGTVDGRQVALACREVVAHMESSRQAWQRAGAFAKDIDWAIQNARIVLQYVRMNGGDQTRDESMAANVKWIADHSDGARMVIWAHNGHVAAGGYPRVTMGKVLREWFGKQMVVFGFAFNQGSFQAREAGKDLRDFTVPPAPNGSLDATLAATGIPVFAVDLRAAPQKGAVRDCLNATHKMRSIGSTFSEATASSSLMDAKVMESFDALLFVEKTTAARRNPQAPISSRPLSVWPTGK